MIPRLQRRPPDFRVPLRRFLHRIRYPKAPQEKELLAA